MNGLPSGNFASQLELDKAIARWRKDTPPPAKPGLLLPGALRARERDHMPAIKGHWVLNVFEGDIERDEYGFVRNPRVDEVDGYNLIDLEAWLARQAEFTDELRAEQLDGYNLVTNSGKGTILDRLYALGGIGAVTKMGVGTSNTAAAVGDTSLTAVDYGPAAFDSTPTRSTLTVTSLQTWSTSQGNITWAELGEFTAANVMLNRIAPIGPYTKTSANSIIVSVALTQA